MKTEDLLFADFDADGRTDVFLANGSRWYVSYGATGPWQQINVSSTRKYQLAVADFTGDGRADVFYGNGSRWYLSDSGTGPWRKINTSSFRTAQLGFADFNGDGRTDVFRANGSAWYVSWSGTSSWQRLNTSATRLSALTFGDFDGDGRDDIFYGNGTVWRVSYGGTGRWQQINRSSRRSRDTLLGDFRGDNRVDVFAPGWAKLHELSARRHSTTTFSNAEADSMFGQASIVLRARDGSSDVACRTQLRRSGAVGGFTVGNGILNSSRQLNDVFDVGGNVKIVRQVNFCANRYRVSYIGCGRMNSKNLIVERTPAVGANRGILMAHEFGHNCGLSHTTGPDRVMRPSISSTNRVITAGECRELK